MSTPLARRLPLVVLAVAAVVAACGGTTQSPSASATAGGTPAASMAAPSTGAGPCAAADLRVTSTGWGAAAGSRGADVMVENAGNGTCAVEGPRIAIVDATGTVVLESEGDTGETVVDAGSSTAFAFTFSNWCTPGPALPMQVALRVGEELIGIDDLAIATTDDLPPCNGEGQPATLSTIPWPAG